MLNKQIVPKGTGNNTSMLKYILFFFVIGLSLISAGCGGQPPKLEIGDQAPPFTLQDLQGNTIRLADMKGKPVLLRFFLTDCKYCRADTPVFNKFYRKYSDQGLQVLYIESLGIDPKVVKTFVRELDILFPVARDQNGKVSASYNVRALPQTIVLDPDHRIVAAILGGVGEDEIANLLTPYVSAAQDKGGNDE